MTRESSGQTIARVLSAYEIGQKLRRLRLRKKIALADLGKHTGLSASLLSQLETGRLVPTLPTLARIAMVFDVGLEHFFADRKGKKLFSVVRAKERMRFPDRADSPSPSYSFECLTFASRGRTMQAYVADFPHRPDPSAAHFHEGGEFLYVLGGTLDVRFGEEEHRLVTGDAAYFDATEPHGYRGVSRNGARAIVVTFPPQV